MAEEKRLQKNLDCPNVRYIEKLSNTILVVDSIIGESIIEDSIIEDSFKWIVL